MTGRREIMLGASALMALSACGGGKFKTYSGPAITAVQVFKDSRRMYLIADRDVIKDYKISLGGDPIGPKRFEGDGKTPEGPYMIDRRNPNSAYHLSLGVSYPNASDRAFAEANGKKPGGDIFIHGQAGKNKGRGRDWTAGCIAVTDDEIEEIYSMVANGTPIHIFP